MLWKFFYCPNISLTIDKQIDDDSVSQGQGIKVRLLHVIKGMLLHIIKGMLQNPALLEVDAENLSIVFHPKPILGIGVEVGLSAVSCQLLRLFGWQGHKEKMLAIIEIHALTGSHRQPIVSQLHHLQNVVVGKSLLAVEHIEIVVLLYLLRTGRRCPAQKAKKNDAQQYHE